MVRITRHALARGSGTELAGWLTISATLQQEFKIEISVYLIQVGGQAAKVRVTVGGVVVVVVVDMRRGKRSRGLQE